MERRSRLGWPWRSGSRLLAAGLAMGSCLGLFGAAGPAGAQAAPAVTELRAVSCYDPAACLAAGNGTVIGMTAASGRWKTLTPPAGAQLLAGVSCPQARVCELAGSGSADDGEVWRTTDGGAKWHLQLTAITGGFFLAVACPSALVCLATGNEGTIYGTVNGGRTWRHDTLPESADLIEGIACPSATTCEAVGYGGNGLALRTTDDGKKWTRQRVPSSVQDLQAVSCPSVAVCVAVGINTIDAGSKEVGTAVTTTDAGVTWTRQADPPGFFDLTGVSCAAAGACEAVGGGTHAVARSTNGGVTWTGQDIPGSVFLQAITCPAIRVCETAGENAADDGVVYGTADSGHAWLLQPIHA